LTQVIAHRGSTHAARENTLAAFAAARELGADGVELDVHLSSDGVVVVHHDAEIVGLGPVADLSSKALPDWLPSLEESLDVCGQLLVNVEVKQDGAASSAADGLLWSKVAEIVLDRGERSRVVVSSFSLEAVDAVHSHAPGLVTALLVEPTDDAMTAVALARHHGHGGVHPFFVSVDEALMEAALAARVAIRPWTVDDPARVVALAGLGVDAVITNDVAGALRSLGRTV